LKCGSFQLQNAAHSKGNGQDRRSTKKQNGKKTKTKQFRTLSSHFTAKILRCFRKLSFAAMTRAQRARKGNGDVKNYPNN
jgi:Skp family chaperone for outer membrane proteins